LTWFGWLGSNKSARCLTRTLSDRIIPQKRHSGMLYSSSILGFGYYAHALLFASPPLSFNVASLILLPSSASILENQSKPHVSHKRLTKRAWFGEETYKMQRMRTQANPPRERPQSYTAQSTASNRLLTSDIVADGKDGANILEIAKLELTNTSPDVVVIELAMSALHLPLHTRIRIA
jgi:hypothetical protein